MKKFTELPYTRPDIDAIKKAFREQVKLLKVASNLEEQIQAIKEINKINADVDTASNLAYIRTDEFYDTERTFFDENGPEIGDLNFEYYTALAGSKFKKELIDNFGEQLFTIASYRVNSFTP